MFTGLQYARDGAEEETINHVLFECAHVIQTWALSAIPLNPNNIPMKSIYVKIDYLFWSTTPQGEIHYFVWILWYIKKT